MNIPALFFIPDFWVVIFLMAIVAYGIWMDS